MSDRNGSRRWSWLTLFVMVAVALGVGMQAQEEPTRSERAQNFAETVKCPRCRGQSVASSDAPIAVELRREIDRRFEEGQNEEQVRQYLLDTYTDEVLLVPPRSGLGSLVWILPVAALVVSFAGLAVVFRRWRGGGESTARASVDDRELVAAARDAGRRAARSDVGSFDDPHGEGDGR